MRKKERTQRSSRYNSVLLTIIMQQQCEAEELSGREDSAVTMDSVTSLLETSYSTVVENFVVTNIKHVSIF